MIWNIRKQKTTNQTTKIKKNPRKQGQWKQPTGQLQKHPNINTIGVPEGEEKEQEIGNLFEKIMKENFLNLVKEIDM